MGGVAVPELFGGEATWEADGVAELDEGGVEAEAEPVLEPGAEPTEPGAERVDDPTEGCEMHSHPASLLFPLPLPLALEPSLPFSTEPEAGG